MSHFTVLVIGDDIEGQLRPYQENNEGDCPKEYLTFHSIEEKSKIEYLTDGYEVVVMPDGRELHPWDDEFRIPGSIGTGTSTHHVPEEYPRKMIFYRDEYPSFEEYMTDCEGYKARDPETGEYGYWENPNAKWDWYQVGGRWTGFFKLKEGAAGEYGDPSLLMDPEDIARLDDTTADVAKKGDIDFEAMRSEAGERARKEYEAVATLFNGKIPRIKTWETCYEEFKDNIDAAREEYRKQPEVQIFSSSKINRNVFGKLEDYPETVEEYIQAARNEAILTFAVVKEGKWYERGKMGWWATVSDKKDDKEWQAEFASLLDSLPDDTVLSVVDCHI